MPQVKIELNTNLNDYINQIKYETKCGNSVLIESKNTTNISKEALEEILGCNVSFLILGGLEKEKYNTDHYRKRVTYSLPEMYHILEEFEKIESRLWGTSYDKALQAYDIFVHEYDTDTFSEEDSRSLRTLINKRGVCAGFSLVYKELMDRQGISCDYVRGNIKNIETKHAWNVLHIDGNIIPLDITNEIVNSKLVNNNMHRYFGISSEFNDQYKPDEDEYIKNYMYGMSYYDVNMRVNSKKKEKTYKVIRNDKSAFHITKIAYDDKVYTYAYENISAYLNGDSNYYGNILLLKTEIDISSLSHDEISCLANVLLDNKRAIEKAMSNGYVGKLYRDEFGKVKKANTSKGLELPRIAIRYFTRSDSTTFAIKYNETEQPQLNDGVFSYNIYEYDHDCNNGTILNEYKIYSSSNLINIPNDFMQYLADFFSKEYLYKNKDKYIGKIYFDGDNYQKTMYNATILGGDNNAR